MADDEQVYRGDITLLRNACFRLVATSAAAGGDDELARREFHRAFADVTILAMLEFHRANLAHGRRDGLAELCAEVVRKVDAQNARKEAP